MNGQLNTTTQQMTYYCVCPSTQSISTIVVYRHPAEEWSQVRGGGWEARAGRREGPDGGEVPAGGAAQGHDSKSVDGVMSSLSN